MYKIEDVKMPSKEEQEISYKSYKELTSYLANVKNPITEIEIEETKEKIKIPLNALKLLANILKATSQGNLISIVPLMAEMTTQAGADLLNVSRPYFVKLLETGKMPYTKVGRHRRVKFTNVMEYKKSMRANQKSLIIEIMKNDEEIGLYDT